MNVAGLAAEAASKTNSAATTEMATVDATLPFPCAPTQLSTAQLPVNSIAVILSVAAEEMLTVTVSAPAETFGAHRTQSEWGSAICCWEAANE